MSLCPLNSDSVMIDRLRSAINSYFVGKEELVDNCLICMLAGGHVLIEDVPGVGKTTLAKALAGAVKLSFGRIQFTPDTLPTDVTGVSVLNMKTGEFEFKKGAVMNQMLLADEINRTSPKTQAALLEAMAEGTVTVDEHTFDLPKPFMVIATQNPIEYLGTYPLPEAQLDRFMMKLSVGYPDEASQIRMAGNYLSGKARVGVQPVMEASDIIDMQEQVKSVTVVDSIIKYAGDIVNLTREETRFVCGVSPRAMLMLLCAARAHAFLEDRDYVLPDDVKAVCVNTLHHRVSLTYEAKIAGESIDSIIYANVLKTKVPMV